MMQEKDVAFEKIQSTRVLHATKCFKSTILNHVFQPITYCKHLFCPYLLITFFLHSFGCPFFF